MGTGSPEDQELDLELPEEPELSPEDQLTTMDHRLIYNYQTNTLDMRKLRVTDIKDCPRLILPPARTTSEEAQILTKESLWCSKYAIYRARNCNEKGYQLTDSMTKQERRGQKKLSKRKASGEIAISTTDKSCEITISRPSTCQPRCQSRLAASQKVKEWSHMSCQSI